MDDVLIYQKENGQSAVEVRLEKDTLWLSMAQVAALFGVNVPAVSKHIRNIYASGELDPSATVSKMETVRQEGRRQVRRAVDFYSLDAVISVGYRVNSTQATRFRIWANRVLKEYLVQGYALNNQRLQAQQEHIKQLECTLTLFQQEMIDQASPSEARGLVRVIADYARAFVLLNQFDSARLPTSDFTTVRYAIRRDEAEAGIAALKADLMAKR